MMLKNPSRIGAAAGAVLLSLALVVLSATPAAAGPFDPAYRGGANSVHAIFDWNPVTLLWGTTLFETGPSAFPLDATVPAVSDDGLDTTVDLPNFVDPLPLKLMRIQLLFYSAVSGDLIAVDVIPSDPDPTVWNVVGGSGSGDSQSHYVDVEILPNPDWEQIIVFGNAGGSVIPGNLLTIEIDTISLPEPSTLVLLGVGLVGLVGCVRRRRDRSATRTN